jgi:hypothetical protein
VLSPFEGNWLISVKSARKYGKGCEMGTRPPFKKPVRQHGQEALAMPLMPCKDRAGKRQE